MLKKKKKTHVLNHIFIRIYSIDNKYTINYCNYYL